MSDFYRLDEEEASTIIAFVKMHEPEEITEDVQEVVDKLIDHFDFY